MRVAAAACASPAMHLRSRTRTRSLRAQQAEKRSASGASSSDSSKPASPDWLDTLNSGLVALFFVILAFGAWLVVGVAEQSALGTTKLSDAWFVLWPVVIQPALGILMTAALVSGGAGWARENGYLK